MRRAGVFITEIEPAAGGVRLAVKDLFDTAGVRTTYGSAIFAEHVPAVTAEAVARLEAAGYVNVGKANLHEFAYGITSDNEHFGRVPNPLAADRTAGGSSGGSAAALAAGLADVALGTDSGGSIRIPAACCGVTGFKPSFGLVPLTGCFPLAPSFDHAGPMARDVEGCRRMMEALVPGLAVAEVGALADLRVGLAWTELADPLVHARVEHAAGLFAHARRVELPLFSNTGALFGREAAEVHADVWREHRDRYGENVAGKIALAMRVTDAQETASARSSKRAASSTTPSSPGRPTSWIDAGSPILRGPCRRSTSSRCTGCRSSSRPTARCSRTSRSRSCPERRSACSATTARASRRS